MSNEGLKVAVLGTGNSGQAFAADLTLKGCIVNLTEVPEFEHTLRLIEKRGGIEISGQASNGFARLNMITTDLGQAVKGVKLIILGGSAFAHEPICKLVGPHLENGQYIMFVSNFAAMRFRRWMKQLQVTADITPVETVSLLYATRAVEPGKVVVTGVKKNLLTACLPSSRTRSFLELVGDILPGLTAADSVLVTSINNLNPVVHPPMVLYNAGRVESCKGKDWNLYSDGATESVTRVMLAMDAERMALLDKVGQKGLAVTDAFASLYSDYPMRKASLSETLRQSPIHGDASMAAPESMDTRYLTEDLPFGLCPWSVLAKQWGVPTPTIDAVIQTATVMLQRDFRCQGLDLKEIGADRLTPEELARSVA